MFITAHAVWKARFRNFAFSVIKGNFDKDYTLYSTIYKAWNLQKFTEFENFMHDSVFLYYCKFKIVYHS